ncbi:MAG: hypothetical protein RMX69_23055, partial [Nostoc sp. EspVER01]|uniref:hypothetical protein n=1 Tax=Nostoc sp. EspVER01 TaxID=3075408 RepID=UPI002AD40BEA
MPIKREIKLESNEIQLEATGEYIFGTQRLSDLVSVIDGRDPKALFNEPNSNVKSSADLLLARIPVGTGAKVLNVKRNPIKTAQNML